MNNKKVHVGIIGGSINNGWAKGTHIPAIQQLPELELVAVSTTRMESAEKSAREFKAAHAFADANELSQHPEVDMVVASVKVAEHYNAVKAVVTAGKHVYCEWPLAANTAQAIEMQQLAESEQIHNTIGLQARQAPEVNYLKGLIAEGYIGKVLSANMKVYTEVMGGFGVSSSKYIFDKSAGGSLFTIYGGHSLDALTYILGDFKELSATLENQYKQAKLIDTDEIVDKTADDQILIQGKLKSGALASVHIQGGVKQQPGLYLEVLGDKGIIILQNAKGSIQMGPYKLMGAQLIEGEQKSPLEELSIPDLYHWVPDSITNQGGPVINVAQALRKFAKDIQEGTFHMPTFKDAVKVHQLLDTIEKAAESGVRQLL